MSLNCIEIEDVLKEFPKSGVMKSFYQPDKNSLVISMYDKSGNYNILLDVTDRFNRICLIPQSEKIIEGKQRFSQFLNSQLSGGKIKNIFQYNFARIIVFEIDYIGTSKKLAARFWGNAGNVILMENDNTILECLKRFPKRNEWPEEEFIFPENPNPKTDFKVRPEFSNGDINDKIYFYYKNLYDSEKFEFKRKKIEDFIDKEIVQLKILLDKINENLNEEKSDYYLKTGELLKANLYKLKKGEKKALVMDYETDKEIEVEIDKNLNPSENVAKFFEKYKKMKEGHLKWEEQQKKSQERLDKFEEIKSYLPQIKELNELENFETKLSEGKLNKLVIKKFSEEKVIGRLFELANGYKAYVSKSAKEADEMLRKVANGNDYWFHIRDYAGSHVVVKEIKNAQLTEDAKIEASILALYFSKGRNSADGDIYFTKVKYLHKGKTGVAGLVFPTQEKNIKVLFDKNILDRIFERSKIEDII